MRDYLNNEIPEWGNLNMADRASFIRWAVAQQRAGTPIDLANLANMWGKFYSDYQEFKCGGKLYSPGGDLEEDYISVMQDAGTETNNLRERTLAEQLPYPEGKEAWYLNALPEEEAIRLGHVRDARGHFPDEVKLPNHPTHPSRGYWTRDNFILNDVGFNNPNLTIFGAADSQDPQARILYNSPEGISTVIPEVTVTPDGFYIKNTYDNILLRPNVKSKGGNLLALGDNLEDPSLDPIPLEEAQNYWNTIDGTPNVLFQTENRPEVRVVNPETGQVGFFDNERQQWLTTPDASIGLNEVVVTAPKENYAKYNTGNYHDPISRSIGLFGSNPEEYKYNSGQSAQSTIGLAKMGAAVPIAGAALINPITVGATTQVLANPFVQTYFGYEGAKNLVGENGVRKTVGLASDMYNNPTWNNAYNLGKSAIGDVFDVGMVLGGVHGGKQVLDKAVKLGDAAARKAYAPYDFMRTIDESTPNADLLNKWWYNNELTFANPTRFSKFPENLTVGDFIGYGFNQGVLKGVGKTTPLSELTEAQKDAVLRLYTAPAVSGDHFVRYRGSNGSKLIHQNETGPQPVSNTGFIPKDVTNSNSPWVTSISGTPEIWWQKNRPYYSALGYPTYQDIPETFVADQRTLEGVGLNFDGTLGPELSQVVRTSGEVPFETIDYGLRPNDLGFFDRIKYRGISQQPEKFYDVATIEKLNTDGTYQPIYSTYNDTGYSLSQRDNFGLSDVRYQITNNKNSENFSSTWGAAEKGRRLFLNELTSPWYKQRWKDYDDQTGNNLNIEKILNDLQQRAEGVEFTYVERPSIQTSTGEARINGVTVFNPARKYKLNSGEEVTDFNTGAAIEINPKIGKDAESTGSHELYHYTTSNSNGIPNSGGQINLLVSGELDPVVQDFSAINSYVIPRGKAYEHLMAEQNKSLLPPLSPAYELLQKDPELFQQTIINMGHKDSQLIEHMQNNLTNLGKVTESRAYLKDWFNRKIVPRLKNPNDVQEIEIFLNENPQVIEEAPEEIKTIINEIRPGSIKEYANYLGKALSLLLGINTTINATKDEK